VGLEDNIYLEKGKLCAQQRGLGGKAGKIIEILGDIVAAPADAARDPGIEGRQSSGVPGRVVARSAAAGGSRAALQVEFSIDSCYPNLV
jgi:hypothetical protein